MKKILLSICLLLITLCPAAFAGDGYAKLGFTGYFPQGDLFKDAHTGLGGEIAFGYYFNENIASELELGINRIKFPIYVMGEKFDKIYELYDVSFNLLASKQLGYIKPYVKAGVGYYFANVPTSLFDDETASSLGEQVGIGISIKNGLGIECKYVMAKPKKDNKEFDSSGPVMTIFWGINF
jgi:hypothetical protein